MSPQALINLSVVLLILGTGLCMVAGALLTSIWLVLVGTGFGVAACVMAFLSERARK